MPTKKFGITSVIESGRNAVKKTVNTISNIFKSGFYICAAAIAATVDFVFNKLFLLIPAIGILVAIMDYKSPTVNIDYGMWCAVTLLLIYMEIKIYFKRQNNSKK